MGGFPWPSHDDWRFGETAALVTFVSSAWSSLETCSSETSVEIFHNRKAQHFCWDIKWYENPMTISKKLLLLTSTFVLEL
jgi:hypothetical protein